MKCFLLILVVVHSLVNVHGGVYDSYKLVSTVPTTQKQLKILVALQNQHLGLDFWTEPVAVGVPVDIMVPPSLQNDVFSYFRTNTVQFNITIENIQILVDKEKERLNQRANRTFDWDEYQELDTIYQWLDELQTTYPDLVQVVAAGTTHQERDIKGLHITFKEGNPMVYIESGMHSREWLAPATSTYIVDQILKSSEDSVLRKFNYFYVPIANPDGYVKTFNEHRMWRKNVRHISENCYGVDLNRNWDHHWSEIGSSDYPCDDTYHGPSAASEIETQSLGKYLKNTVVKTDIILCLHTYSQLLMYPWGYTDAPAPNQDELDRAAKAGAAAIASVNGKQFKTGPISTTIYPVSGSSMEWAYQNLNARLAYVYELRPSRNYEDGFAPGPEHILPSGKEIHKSVEVILQVFLEL